jgi:hypothetical protein
VQHRYSDNAPSARLPSIYELASGTVAPGNDVLSVARIDFAQMIKAAGAQSVIDAMIEHFGVTAARMRDIIASSGPFFFRAHQHWMDRPGGIDELNKLVRSGGPQQFADRPGLVSASVSRQEGRVFLQYLFLEDEVLDLVTQRIAARLDVSSRKLEEMMPSLAALFVGVLCKSMTP